MDSKRDLDGEKRLIRNEKARRRRALQYACRYLPIELEKKIFNYMKNPNNGRIDVSMKWQKHPVAKIISHQFHIVNISLRPGPGYDPSRVPAVSRALAVREVPVREVPGSEASMDRIRRNYENAGTETESEPEP